MLDRSAQYDGQIDFIANRLFESIYISIYIYGQAFHSYLFLLTMNYPTVSANLAYVWTVCPRKTVSQFEGLASINLCNRRPRQHKYAKAIIPSSDDAIHITFYGIHHSSIVFYLACCSVFGLCCESMNEQCTAYYDTACCVAFIYFLLFLRSRYCSMCRYTYDNASVLSGNACRSSKHHYTSIA